MARGTFRPEPGPGPGACLLDAQHVDLATLRLRGPDGVVCDASDSAVADLVGGAGAAEGGGCLELEPGAAAALRRSARARGAGAAEGGEPEGGGPGRWAALHVAEASHVGAVRGALAECGVRAAALASPLEVPAWVLIESAHLSRAAGVLVAAGFAVGPAPRLCRPPGARAAGRGGVWGAAPASGEGPAEADGLPRALRLESAAGVFVDIRIPAAEGAAAPGHAEASSGGFFVASAGSATERWRDVATQPRRPDAPAGGGDDEGPAAAEGLGAWAPVAGAGSATTAALELVGAEGQRGYWLFAGTLFARVVGLPFGEGLVGGYCCRDAERLNGLSGGGASAELRGAYEAVLGRVERPGVLRVLRRSWASGPEDLRVPLLDAGLGAGGGGHALVDREAGIVVHTMPGGCEQRWRILEMKEDPFTPPGGFPERPLGDDGTAPLPSSGGPAAEDEQAPTERGGASSSEERKGAKQRKDSEKAAGDRGGKRAKSGSGSDGGRERAKKKKRSRSRSQSDRRHKKGRSRSRSKKDKGRSRSRSRKKDDRERRDRRSRSRSKHDRRDKDRDRARDKDRRSRSRSRRRDDKGRDRDRARRSASRSGRRDDRDKDKAKEKDRDKDREKDKDKERERQREKDRKEIEDRLMGKDRQEKDGDKDRGRGRRSASPPRRRSASPRKGTALASAVPPAPLMLSSMGGLGGGGISSTTAALLAAAQLQQGEPNPEVDQFLAANPVEGHAAIRLRTIPMHLQREVMSRGSLLGARDPSAVLISRIRDAMVAGERAAGLLSMTAANPFGGVANPGVEALISRYSLDAQVSTLLRALPPQLQQMAAELPVHEARNPSAFVMAQLQLPRFRQAQMSMPGAPSPAAGANYSMFQSL